MSSVSRSYVAVGSLFPDDADDTHLLTLTVHDSDSSIDFSLQFGHPNETPPTFTVKQSYVGGEPALRYSISNAARVPTEHPATFDGDAQINIMSVSEDDVELKVDYVFPSYDSFGVDLTLTSPTYDSFAHLALSNTQTTDFCRLLKDGPAANPNNEHRLIFPNGDAGDLKMLDIDLPG